MSNLSFILLTVMSAPNKLSDLYLQQLREAGIEYHVDQIRMTSPNDGTIGRCVLHWRDLASRFSTYDRLIITDGWDVLCYGSHAEVAQALALFDDYPTFAAERNCYPEPHLAKTIPDVGPFRFVNGGMLTASPAALAGWCEAVEAHPKFDPFMLGQQWLNRRLAEGDGIVQIDSRTQLFYCHFLENGELGMLNGRPYNTIHETFPPFQHFNGSWPVDGFLEMVKFAEVRG